MRIPEKPPSDQEVGKVLAEAQPQNKLKELRPYLDYINSNYLHWSDILVKFKDKNLTHHDLLILWGYTNLTRQVNTQFIKISNMILRYVQTPHLEKELHDVDMLIGDKIELEDQVPSPTLRKKYLVSSLMEEAIASSQLEGAVTTKVIAKRMLLENRKPRDKSEQMISNNYATMKYIKEHVNKESEPLTLEIIKELHKIITKDTLEKKEYEGAFRMTDEVVVVSDDNKVLHTPPYYKEIEILLQQVCNFVNSESSTYYYHPIVKAIMLHYMIGYVHPFHDGNGRTARALFYWYIMSQHYDYLEYIAISTAIKHDPAKYTLAYLYSESDHNDITYFVEFNLHAIRIATTLFKEYIEKTKKENKKIIETIRFDNRLNLRQADVIISMSKTDKHITIEEMQERYNVRYQTARTDLLELVELGYMHKLLIGRQFVFDLDKEKVLEATNNFQSRRSIKF